MKTAKIRHYVDGSMVTTEIDLAADDAHSANPAVMIFRRVDRKILMIPIDQIVDVELDGF